MKKITLESLAERIEALEGKKNWTLHEVPAKALEWGEDSKETMGWEAADKWCKERGGRLPTVLELQQAYYDRVEGFTQSFIYWSSTTYPAHYSYAMDVYFNVGYTGSSGKTISNYVRCVRG
jgi:hypothetical protein